MKDAIEIIGARAHNLKNVSVSIPLNKITCVSGPSGSGKSSLFFHTLVSESKRKLISSFPNDFKFFMERPVPVDVDSIKPVLPTFSLPQNNPIIGSRPTISDVIGVTNSLAALFFLKGIQRCPFHKTLLRPISLKTKIKKIYSHLSKVNNELDEEVVHIFIKKNDYNRIYPNGPSASRAWDKENYELSDDIENFNFWEIGRVKLSKIDSKLNEKDFNFVKNYFIYFKNLKKYFELKITSDLCCEFCDFQKVRADSIKFFSPLTSAGSCSNCNGFGTIQTYGRMKFVPNDKRSFDQDAILFFKYKKFRKYKSIVRKIFIKNGLSTTEQFRFLEEKKWSILENGEDGFPGILELLRRLEKKRYKKTVRIFLSYFKKEIDCPACFGRRIGQEISDFLIKFDDVEKSYSDLLGLTILDLKNDLQKINISSEIENKTFNKKVKEMIKILSWATFFGLGSIPVVKKIKELQAGEYQRALLLKYICYEDIGSLFVFDEPCLGLSKDEQIRVISGLRKLSLQGNTIVVIDHSPVMQKMADHNIVMGRGAGYLGGEILFSSKNIPNRTLQSFNNYKIIDNHTKTKNKICKIKEASFKNLPPITFSFPVNSIVTVIGSSSSGKQEYIFNTFADYLQYDLSGDHLFEEFGTIKKVDTNFNYKKIILVNSKVHSGNSRSSFGSLTGLSDRVRKYLAGLPISQSLALKEGHFSSNSKLGQCPDCEGRGNRQIEMQYLEDVVLECESCNGRKIRDQYSQISDGFYNAFEYFNKPINEVIKKIPLTPKYRKILSYIDVLNLGHLSLERSIPSLSGGEKQRVYFLSVLMNEIRDSFIFCENISFGLSYNEVENMLVFLRSLTHKNNSVVILDQSDTVIRNSDFIVDLDKIGESKIQIPPIFNETNISTIQPEL